MRRRDVQAELLNQRRQTGCLSFRELEDQAGQGRGVDDRVLQRAFEPASDEPCIKGVVTVLNQHGALRETQESPACVSKLWRADEHRAVDVVATAGIRVDRGAAVDQGVEKGERAIQPEAFGADLEYQEWGIPRGLDVEGDKLRILELRLRAKLRRIDRDLLPRHGPGGATRLDEERLGAHLARARARLAHAISPLSTARSNSAAPA